MARHQQVALATDQAGPTERADGDFEPIRFAPVLWIANAGDAGHLVGHQGRVLVQQVVEDVGLFLVVCNLRVANRRGVTGPDARNYVGRAWSLIPPLPAPGAFQRRPGRLWTCLAQTFLVRRNSLNASDKLRQRDFERRRQLDEIPIARIPQPALDLADVRSVHPGKIGQSLLRETVDFAAPCPNRIAKVP